MFFKKISACLMTVVLTLGMSATATAKAKPFSEKSRSEQAMNLVFYGLEYFPDVCDTCDVIEYGKYDSAKVTMQDGSQFSVSRKDMVEAGKVMIKGDYAQRIVRLQKMDVSYRDPKMQSFLKELAIEAIILLRARVDREALERL